MASLKENLEATRPEYDAEGVFVRFLLDAYTGRGGFQGRVKQPASGFWGAAAEAYSNFSVTLTYQGKEETDSYLDRFPREDAEKFMRRRYVAHYLNYCRPITGLLTSYVIRKMHKRTDVPEKLANWIEATQYDKGWRKRALKGSVLGWFPVAVDQPRAVDAPSRAQQGDLDPYVVEMLPCQLREYQLDEAGALLWAKLATEVCEKAAWDQPAAKVTRYTIWTRTDFATYEQRGDNGEEVQRTGGGPHSFGKVPVVSWRVSTSVEDPVKSDSIMADIALEGRRLFNVVSEMDEHIRGQVFAILAVPSRTIEDGAADVGSTNGLQFDPETKHLPTYIAPPASVAATLETRMEKSVIEIYRIARVEYDKASGTATSAQSKQQNFEQTNALLCDIAAGLAESDYETLCLVGTALGCSAEELAKMKCTPYTTYATEDLAMELEQAVEALTLSIGNTAKVLLQQRLVRQLIPNMTADEAATVDSEIEEAVEQAQKDAEAAQAALTEGAPVNDESPSPDDDETPAGDDEEEAV